MKTAAMTAPIPTRFRFTLSPPLVCCTGAPQRDLPLRRLPRRSTGLVAFTLSDGEHRDSGEWRTGAQVRRCEDRAPRDRHDDALRFAGAEADRAEVAVH